MKKLITCLAAGLLVVGGQSLLAQTTSTNSAPSTTQEPKHRGHGDILRLVGLTPADVKGLNKEERQAKIKQAALNVQSELQAKQTAGTLTPEGQKRLDHIDKLLARLNKTSEN